MVQAVRQAEYDFYQRGKAPDSDRFIPTSVALIRAMLQAGVGSAPYAKKDL